jgi:hypothetical protein
MSSEERNHIRQREEANKMRPAFLANLKDILDNHTNPTLATEYFALAQKAFYDQDDGYKQETRSMYIDKELINLFKAQFATPSADKPARLKLLSPCDELHIIG